MKLLAGGGASYLTDLLDTALDPASEGQIIYYDATTSLWKNTSILLVDDVNSRIGIGTLTPDGTLHVHTNSAGVVTALSVADDLVIENNTSCGLSILTPQSNAGRIIFGTPATNAECQIRYDHGAGAYTGSLSIYTGGGQTVVVTAATQRVGIGTSAPDGKLHVHTGTAGAVAAHATADDFIVENNGNVGMSLLAPDTGLGSIFFGNASDNVGAILQWNYNSNLYDIATDKAGASFRILTGSQVEAIRVTSTQTVGIGTTIPDGTLHVHTASAGTVTANGDADDLVVENSVNTGLSILAGTPYTASLYFGHSAAPNGAQIFWNYGAGNFTLTPNKAGATTYIGAGSGTIVMNILSTSRVGINIASPDGTLHVQTATAGAVTANAVADDLVVENSGSGGITILTPDASAGILAFGSPTDNYGAYIQYQQSTAELTIGSHLTGGVVAINAGTGSSQAVKMDDDSTAGNTRFFLYDVDNGQLERVTVGAADSGGSGYKVLRIPN